jgi:hypothetical protein
MWALTLAQVPATLVGYETPNEAGVRLLDEKMVDVVLSILGPLMTELFTPWRIKQEASTKAASMV